MGKLIYIADDEKNIRDLIKAFLSNAGYEVVVFQSGDELCREFSKNKADLLILDIMMPGIDGLTLCTKIREKSQVPIIIVSARDSELDRITGITLGSDDYLTKPFSPIELVVRVKAIFRRIDSVVKNEVSKLASFGNIRLDISLKEAYCNDNKLSLTPTEFGLTEYLLNNKERAVSRDELLREVWKFEYEVDTRVTDDAIKRLRKKLITNNANIKIESVWGYGFKVVLEEKNEDDKK